MSIKTFVENKIIVAIKFPKFLGQYSIYLVMRNQNYSDSAAIGLVAMKWGLQRESTVEQLPWSFSDMVRSMGSRMMQRILYPTGRCVKYALSNFKKKLSYVSYN